LIKVHGHRGARARRPENTLAAFAYAIEAGADAVELDVAVTRDDVLVVSHDPVLAGSGEIIRERSLAGLRGRIPTLEQVFDLVKPSRAELNIELKSFPDEPQYTPAPDRFAALLLDLMRRHVISERVMVQSFDFRVTRAMQSQAPEIRRGALTEDDPRDFPAIALDAGNAHYVAPLFSLVTPAKVIQAHDAGIQVIPWTVNSPDDWRRMVEAGVDAIITDDPAALLDWLCSA